MNENNQQHTPITPTGSWGVITEVDNGFNGEPKQSELMKAARMALEALSGLMIGREAADCHEAEEAIVTLHAAIESAEKQTPSAWIEHEWSGTGLRKLHFERPEPTVRDEVVNPIWTPLYTIPPAALAKEPDLAKAYLEELDKLSQRNYELRMENAELKTTPSAAQRQWVGLTDEDKLTVRRIPWETLGNLMDNIEAKLKEKNS